MWILATWGALMPSLRKNCPKDDPRTIQIRFRRIKDARYLSENYLGRTLDFDSPIVTDAGTDYDARIYVRPDSLQSVMSKLATEIDYTSFKDQTEKKHGDKQLHDAYYAVWRVLYDKLSTRKAFTRPRTSRWSYGDFKGNRTTSVVVDEVTRRTKRTTIEPAPEPIEWRKMSELSTRQLALLHQEIDAATADVDLPSDEELDKLAEMINEWPRWDEKRNQLDHTGCEHPKTKSARRICRRQYSLGEVL